jgi:exopolysaccharide biosynthesis predicted pyruvyltransferase EpsI
MKKMKRKVAILTQAPLGTNYGNSAQAYALQTVLRKASFEPMVLDRVKYDIYKITHWSLSQIKNEILNFIDKKHRMTPRVFNAIFKGHFLFVEQYINLSERLHTDEELRKHFQNNTYDAIIVGSDQTWRPPYSPNIYNYFLDFLEDNTEITKLAYATSFGTSDWEFSEEETKRCARLIQQFDAVSVREESAVEMTTKYLNKDSVWVLDPTLLLVKSDYQKLIDARRQPKRSGIYSYILDETQEISEFIENAQHILGLDHFTNQPKVRNKEKATNNLADYKYPTLEGWLQGFEEADFVITNSFHGTVFSIIFNKPFLSIVNKERGASRFYSLLGKLGLESRIIETANLSRNQIEEFVKQKIDFTVANLKLEEMKKESLAFLLNALDK